MCVIRERLADTLLCEGYAEDSRLYADQLACAYWRHNTLDNILLDLKFILDAEDYAGILGFCKLQYPILFATLPSALVSGEAEVPGLKHDTHGSSGILDSAASRADSFRAIWPAAFGSMVSQQQPQPTME